MANTPYEKKEVFVPGGGTQGMSAEDLFLLSLTFESLAASGNLVNPHAAANRAEVLLDRAIRREAYEQGVGESSP